MGFSLLLFVVRGGVLLFTVRGEGGGSRSSFMEGRQLPLMPTVVQFLPCRMPSALVSCRQLHTYSSNTHFL